MFAKATMSEIGWVYQLYAHAQGHCAVDAQSVFVVLVADFWDGRRVAHGETCIVSCDLCRPSESDCYVVGAAWFFGRTAT